MYYIKTDKGYFNFNDGSLAEEKNHDCAFFTEESAQAFIPFARAMNTEVVTEEIEYFEA